LSVPLLWLHVSFPQVLSRIGWGLVREDDNCRSALTDAKKV